MDNSKNWYIPRKLLANVAYISTSYYVGIILCLHPKFLSIMFLDDLFLPYTQCRQYTGRLTVCGCRTRSVLRALDITPAVAACVLLLVCVPVVYSVFSVTAGALCWDTERGVAYTSTWVTYSVSIQWSLVQDLNSSTRFKAYKNQNPSFNQVFPTVFQVLKKWIIRNKSEPWF